MYDPKTGRFAPSKFCAYTRFASEPSLRSSDSFPLMDVPSYVKIDQGAIIFDGNRAWRHLVRIGFERRKLRDFPASVKNGFEEWLRAVAPAISAYPAETEILQLRSG